MGKSRARFAAATLALLLGAADAVAATAAKKAPAAKPASGGGAHTGSAAGSGLVGAVDTFELGLSGFADLTGSDQTAAYVDLRLGYFAWSGIEIGASVLEGTTPSGQRDVAGLFGEYDWLFGSRFVPFAGGALLHDGPPRGGDGSDGRVLRGYGGVNVVITPNVAFALTTALSVSDHDVLGPETNHRRSERTTDLGLRLFF